MGRSGLTGSQQNLRVITNANLIAVTEAQLEESFAESLRGHLGRSPHLKSSTEKDHVEMEAR